VEKDYENIDDIDDLSDNELRALVKDTFDQQLFFDPDDVDVHVHNHIVTLSGRIGTEEELRVAERVVSDLVGIENVKNNMLVDPIRRAESPSRLTSTWSTKSSVRDFCLEIERARRIRKPST